MKVLNITMQAVNNYGSVLQTYATERIFQDLGCEVETLDYIQENLQMNSVRKVLKYGGPGWKIKLKQLILLLIKKENTRRAEIMDAFRERYLHLTKRYMSVRELEADLPKADVYCTGSDQTWNTVINGVSKAYFLGFAPDDKKKISFSASFGIEKLPEKDKSEVKKLLSRYDAISVRESSGLSILNGLGINNATFVLDPTLVVESNIWHDMTSERLISEDYIFVYQLNTSRKFVDYVNRFSSHKKLQVVYVKSRKINQYKNAFFKENPTIDEWLSLFKYASYIITDSFHGTLFSLIFQKKFIDIYPPNFSARIASILKLTGLEGRHVEDLSILDYCDREIDYDKVNSIIEERKNLTKSFLRGSLNK